MEHNVSINLDELLSVLGYVFWPALFAVLLSSFINDIHSFSNFIKQGKGLRLSRSVKHKLEITVLVGLASLFFCISVLMAASLSLHVLITQVGFFASFALILSINSQLMKKCLNSLPRRELWRFRLLFEKAPYRTLLITFALAVVVWGGIISYMFYLNAFETLSHFAKASTLISVWLLALLTLAFVHKFLRSALQMHHAHAGQAKQAHPSQQHMRMHRGNAQSSPNHNHTFRPHQNNPNGHAGAAFNPNGHNGSHSVSLGAMQPPPFAARPQAQGPYGNRAQGQKKTGLFNLSWPRFFGKADKKRAGKATGRAGGQSLAKPNLPAPFMQQPQSQPVSEDDKTYSFLEVKQKCREAFHSALIISMFSNILMLTGPLFMLQVYDRVLTSGSAPTLWALFTLVIALFVFMGVLDIIRSRILVRIGVRVDRLLSRQVFDTAIGVKGGADSSGKTQLLRDLRQIRSFVASPGMTSIFDMPWAPLYFAIVFLLHWMLGVMALVGAAVLVVLALINEFMSREPVAQATKETGESDSVYEAGRRNSEILQAMGMGKAFRERWLSKHYAGLASNTKAADLSGSFATITKVLRLFLQSAMLAAGAFLVLQGQLSPGSMIAASIIMSRGLAPIEQAIGQWRNFISTRQSLDRLKTEFEDVSQDDDRIELPPPRGFIRVENVYAAPNGSREPVLKGLNFDLMPGDALGVLGPSGSGKSTLARVLVGVCPTLKGTVRLDSAALDHWPQDQLGRYVGYLPQNAELFSGTIAENISRFSENAPPQLVIEAAHFANVHEMISALPEGYNTKVGESGMSLSGGQRQRIALARALYCAPALVVLDEPNSNLDKDGEQALSNAIRMMREIGRTFIIMAHRPNVLENVNKIMVLNNGTQESFGPKEKILKPKKVSLSPTKPKILQQGRKKGQLQWKQQ